MRILANKVAVLTQDLENIENKMTERIAALEVEVAANKAALDEEIAANKAALEEEFAANKAATDQKIATLQEVMYESLLSMVTAAVDASKTSLYNFINATVEAAIAKCRFTT